MRIALAIVASSVLSLARAGEPPAVAPVGEAGAPAGKAAEAGAPAKKAKGGTEKGGKAKGAKEKGGKAGGEKAPPPERKGEAKAGDANAPAEKPCEPIKPCPVE